MKSTGKNEMDLLLRTLARSRPASHLGSARSQSERNIGEHLDADELNCYAEGVATAPERARYVKHLADCEPCRSQVANLVPVASVLRREPVEQKTARGFREKLAAFWSPAVLRYALPALVLTSVLGIAIIALRQQRQASFIAKNETATTPDLAKSDQPQTLATNSGLQTATPPSAPAQLPANARDKNVTEAKPVQGNQPGTVAPATRTEETMGEAKEDSRANKTAVDEPQLTDAVSPAAAPPPPRPASDDLKKMAEARKQEEEDIEKRRREDSNFQMRSANEAERAAGPRKGPSRGSGAQNVGALSSAMARDKDQKAASPSAESRTVAGRVFRRQGDAWIDTGYSAGRATINVKRGSEQFRALVADEPDVRSIAAQLAGEVIVIWKGTAYRIN